MDTCRCDGMVDVVDSKSTAGDSVPVRVRSPAPKKRAPRGLSFLVSGRRTRTHQNATVRWAVATRRFRRVLHSVLESGCRNHCPKSLVFQGFGLFSFQFSRPGEKEVLTDLRRRFLGITGEAIPIFCRRQDFFTNSLPILSGFFQQDSLK